MAVLTEVAIKIGESEISDFLDLSLTQQMLMHHHLYITIRKDLIEKDQAIFKESQNYIGKPIFLVIKAPTNEETRFTGIVYEIKTIRSNQSSGDLIQIHALSPDAKMADVRTFRSFEEKSLKNIVSTIFDEYAIAGKNVSTSVEPQLNPDIAYTVQFNESGFDFIKRLAIRHGQWFLYDGQKLHFGSLPQKSTKLEFGKDLFDFTFSLKIQSLNFAYVAQDYMLNKPETSKPGNVNVPRISKPAFDNSEKIFQNTSNHFYQGSFFEKPCRGELDTIAKAPYSAVISDMMLCEGSSDDPDLIVGGIIEINEGEIFHGRFRVVQVYHHCDRNGNYKNNFKAIPADVPAPPYSNPDLMPLAEPHTGLVTDNADPEGLGRIRVQLFWQQARSLVTPWLRMTTPYAGVEKGFHFVPEVGEEVMVGFEGGNPERPYILGAIYHGKAKPDKRWTTDQNDFKTIRSRSGHTIEMIDKEGKEEIKIYDGSPDKYNYSITLASHSKEILVEAKGDMEIKADNIRITANQNFELKANNIKQSADANVDISAKSNVAIKATSKMILDGGAQMEQKSSAKMSVNGGGKMDLKAGIVKIN